jgi:hypothetical protein
LIARDQSTALGPETASSEVTGSGEPTCSWLLRPTLTTALTIDAGAGKETDADTELEEAEEAEKARGIVEIDAEE